MCWEGASPLPDISIASFFAFYNTKYTCGNLCVILVKCFFNLALQKASEQRR